MVFGRIMMRNILITGLMILLMVPGLFGQELTGEEIIQKVNDLFNVDSSYGKSKMTITTSSGQKRTFISESWSKDKGEKNLVRYLEPSGFGSWPLMPKNRKCRGVIFPTKIWGVGMHSSRILYQKDLKMRRWKEMTATSWS
jgi:hypothetical protein